VEVESQGNGYDKDFSSDDAGALNVAAVPYGVYRVRVTRVGFAPAVRVVVVRSALPVEEKVELAVAGVLTQVSVEAGEKTLIDPYSPSSVMQVGTKQIEKRVTSLPGRSVQDLVNTQPGWLYEGNAVLHPRGSEYQTQFVVDGIPLTDNRSPSFGPEIEADDLDSMTVYTAGYPAEYGRKLGGVVELNTRRQTDAGLHGQVVAAGGSYDSLSGYGRVQELAGKNTFGASVSGAMTSHYLNPVVPENYTNKGTIGDFAGSYGRDRLESDRLSFTVRHELSRFEIPNERVQQAAGQLQAGGNFETMGIVQYQHILSPDSLVSLSDMVRDNE